MTTGTAEIRLFNTLTKSKDPFVPLDPENVRMYVCGPTVYDYAHIGNARPAIVFDVLFRLLRHTYGEDHVTYVRNITDVDDKINARAVRDFPDLPLNDAIAKVTEKTEQQYFTDMKALGCLAPTHEPRATAHIDGMVKMIQTLLDKGNAYVATGDEGMEVLFDTKSMPDYGKLSRRKLDEQMAGARVAVEAHKKDPADFVLWKQSSDTQPGWDGTFTFDAKSHTIKGRPGWHIECSVMSEALLGDSFDIHGGGLDLIFPHHENELAQSRCAHGKDVMANVWMHNGFLQVEGEKMSKSLGNFYTVDELLSEEKFGGWAWPGDVLRLAMLMTHYREPIDFTLARLQDAQTELVSWSSMVEEYRPKTRAEPSAEFLHAVRDDLNLPAALAVVRSHWKGLRSPKSSEVELRGHLSNFLGALEFLNLNPVHVANVVEQASPISDELHEELNELLVSRLEARARRDWAESDRIRDEIEKLGFRVKDVPDGAGNIVPRLEPL